jgi:hypothetical protein
MSRIHYPFSAEVLRAFAGNVKNAIGDIWSTTLPSGMEWGQHVDAMDYMKAGSKWCDANRVLQEFIKEIVPVETIAGHILQLETFNADRVGPGHQLTDFRADLKSVTCPRATLQQLLNDCLTKKALEMKLDGTPVAANGFTLVENDGSAAVELNVNADRLAYLLNLSEPPGKLDYTLSEGCPELYRQPSESV